jgi:excinuclease ABC subunit A
MTELNDHLKLLFARATRLYCRGCGEPVRRDTPDSIVDALFGRVGENAPRALISFAVEVPDNFTDDEIEALLAQQGYTRVHRRRDKRLEVIQDRVRLTAGRRQRIVRRITFPSTHPSAPARPVAASGEHRVSTTAWWCRMKTKASPTAR